MVDPGLPPRFWSRWQQTLTIGVLMGTGGLLMDGVPSPAVMLTHHAVKRSIKAFDVAQVESPPEPAPETLPQSVADAVLDAIADTYTVDRSQLDITDSQPRLWSDGCLGLGPVGRICQEVLVVGWQVTVVHDRREWVYRTNNSGTLIEQDRAGASVERLFTLPSTPMGSNRPDALPKKAIFRLRMVDAQAQTLQETILFKNGQLLQWPIDAEEPSSPTVVQLPRTTVKQFRRFLKQQQFRQFDQRCFLPTSRVANRTIYLSSKQADVCYANTSRFSQLPPELQQVIQRWMTLDMSSTGTIMNR